MPAAACCRRASRSPTGGPTRSSVQQQVGKWQVLRATRRTIAPLPYGLSGFVIRAASAADHITLQAKDEAAFDTVESASTASPRRQDRRGGRRMAAWRTTRHASRRTRWRDAPSSCRLGQLAWRCDRWRRSRRYRRLGRLPRARGIVLTSHGFSGRRSGIMDRWDWGTVASSWANCPPRSFSWPSAPTRVTRPRAACRITRRLEARRRAEAGSAQCLDRPGLPARCQPHPQLLRGRQRSHARAGRCRPSEVAGLRRPALRSDRSLCRWHTPRSYDLVRSAQQRGCGARRASISGTGSSSRAGCAAPIDGSRRAGAQRSRAHEERRLLGAQPTNFMRC